MSGHLGGCTLWAGCRKWLSPQRPGITGRLAEVSRCACGYTKWGACTEWLFLANKRGTTSEREEESRCATRGTIWSPNQRGSQAARPKVTPCRWSHPGTRLYFTIVP